MFVRIVKMSFHSKHINEFEEIFAVKKALIRASKGCTLLELYQDLENYRNSALFKNVWAKTKVLFNDKPQAWSVNKNVSLS